jgi:hypothetical protein
MIPASRSIRALAGALLLASVAISLSTCSGIGGSEFAGGGTGGTGISTGSVSGFGSVVVNGVHYRTDGEVAPQFVTKKIYNGNDNSSKKDRELFQVGMVVTVRHAPEDNNALEIEYRDNLQGVIAAKVSGTENLIEVLGQSIVVDNAALFALIQRNDIVEVSGFVDDAGRIRAVSILPISPSVREFEVKGFVSGLSLPDATFRLGPLPDGSGASVTVSFGPASVSGLAGGLANGLYVDVATTDREPVGGIITATRIVKLAARTEFPDGTPVDLEGLVTTPWSGSVNDLSFAVEGKRVRWNDTTEFAGGGVTQEDTRQTNRKVQVQGTETGGVLSAARIVFR